MGPPAVANQGGKLAQFMRGVFCNNEIVDSAVHARQDAMSPKQISTFKFNWQLPASQAQK